MRTLTLSAATLVVFGAMMGTAQADYQFCPTTGDVCLGGGPGTLVGASETWAYDADFGLGGSQPDWGSPGVDLSVTAYAEADPAFGFVINFDRGILDSSAIAIGNAAACAGTTTGGTTFCSISPTDIWEAFQTGPSSIEFLAQNPTFDMITGQDYFVNIFFEDGSALPRSFTGAWLTSFSPTPSPEPATLAMFGVGLVGIYLAKRRGRA